MPKTFFCISTVVALAAVALPGSALAQAQKGANISGSYQCVPEPSPCQWPGQTLTITQSGSTVDLKNKDGTFADGKLTSDTTISGGPPWNSLGVILPDHSIQWSNGRLWRKL